MQRKYLAIIPFALILLCILAFYLGNVYHIFTFDTIQYEHLKWSNFAHAHPILSALYFMGIYIATVMLVIPASTFLTVLGGFLFPMPLAIAYACISETIGATLFFLASRLATEETLGEKRQGVLAKMQKELYSHQACYLLFLRFSHLLPFWLVNFGAGVFHLRTRTFIWTTLIGVIPLTFFLVEGGESLSKYFETHTHFTLKEIFTTQLKISLLGLGLIALLPIAYQKYRSRHKRW
jgi:uncharacterized membrane protein YdjX (TVP38/TMEM64 family)